APRMPAPPGRGCPPACRRARSTAPCCVTRCASTTPRSPGCISGPAPARSSPAATRATRGSWSPPTCPTCYASARRRCEGRRCGRRGWHDMAVTVLVPGVLRGDADGAARLELAAQGTLADVVREIGERWPRLERRICDERGEIRRFVNVY